MMNELMLMMITSTVSPWRTVQGGPARASHLKNTSKFQIHFMPICSMPSIYNWPELLRMRKRWASLAALYLHWLNYQDDDEDYYGDDGECQNSVTI